MKQESASAAHTFWASTGALMASFAMATQQGPTAGGALMLGAAALASGLASATLDMAATQLKNFRPLSFAAGATLSAALSFAMASSNARVSLPPDADAPLAIADATPAP